MRLFGFEMDYYDEYHNDKYKIFDAVPNNVLYGIDGNLYFIDTQIRIKRCIRMQYWLILWGSSMRQRDY